MQENKDQEKEKNITLLKNIDALKNFQPNIYQKIKNYNKIKNTNWEWINSNTNCQIPIYCKKHLIHSKYDPQKEATRIIDSIPKEKVFTILLGFGAGYTAEAFIHNKDSKCLIIETNIELFYETICIKDLSNIFSSKNIFLILFDSIFEIENQLFLNYFPANDGGLFCIEQRSLTELFKTEYEAIREVIQKTIFKIKSDYSVQAHFGKVWTKNIISNSFVAKKNKELIFNAINNIKEKQKKKFCIILAAGPTLDNDLKKIINKENDYCIIATDTAYQAAIQNGITPDFFVTIDGQPYSNEQIAYYLSNKTTIIATLSANSSLVHNCIKKENSILFFKTKHPLEQFICSGDYEFPYIETGTGTVTISAISFAKQLGFNNFFLLGADFAYTDGKPYAKGTYLDSQIEKKTTRINNSETFFCSLMFRSNVQKEKTKTNKISYLTETMNSYKSGTLDFIKKNDLTILETSKLNSTFCEENSFCKKNIMNNNFSINISKLLLQIDSNLNYLLKFLKSDKNSSEQLKIILQPLMAWTNKNFPKEDSFTKSLKITDKIIKHFIF